MVEIDCAVAYIERNIRETKKQLTWKWIPHTYENGYDTPVELNMRQRHTENRFEEMCNTKSRLQVITWPVIDFTVLKFHQYM